MNAVTQYKPVKPVELRRRMANDPLIMARLEPLEKSVFLASTAKPFAEWETGELSKELSKALRFIFKDTGFRSTDETELGYLVVRVCEIAKRYYGNLSLNDFRMAFEMGITGELDEYLPKGRDGQADRGHYQQFNAEYVCKILNAYKAKRAWIIKKANDALPNKEETITPEVKQYYRNMTRQNVILAYEYYKSKGELPAMSPIAEMLYYNELASVGLADEIVVTLEEQTQILNRTIHNLTRKGMMGDVARLREAGTDAEEIQPGAFALSRRKALKDAFERMMVAGTDIKEYIKFE